MEDCRSLANSFLMTDDSHCDRGYSSLTADLCRRLCGKEASGLERMLCEVLVSGTPGKHGQVH